MANWKKTMLGAPAGAGKDILYASYNVGVAAIDVTDPTNPSVVATKTGRGQTNCAVDEGSDYVYNFQGGTIYAMYDDLSGDADSITVPAAMGSYLEWIECDMTNEILTVAGTPRNDVYFFDLNSDGTIDAYNSSVGCSSSVYDIFPVRKSGNGGVMVATYGGAKQTLFKKYPGSSASNDYFASYGFSVYADKVTGYDLVYMANRDGAKDLRVERLSNGTGQTEYYYGDGPYGGNMVTNSSGDLVFFTAQYPFGKEINTTNTTNLGYGMGGTYYQASSLQYYQPNSGGNVIVDYEKDLCWVWSGYDGDIKCMDISDVTNITAVGSAFDIESALSNPSGFNENGLTLKKGVTSL